MRINKEFFPAIGACFVVVVYTSYTLVFEDRFAMMWLPAIIGGTVLGLVAETLSYQRK